MAKSKIITMLCYTIRLEEDDGTLLVTSPDFPELTTFGENHDEALGRAVDALEEAVAARIHDRRDIPMPSPGEITVQLPALTAVKVLLYQGMRDENIGKAELARRLGWHLPQVDRVLNVNHHSRLDRMEAALRAIGLRIEVVSAPHPRPTPATTSPTLA
jgi:antitoxin HicB